VSPRRSDEPLLDVSPGQGGRGVGPRGGGSSRRGTGESGVRPRADDDQRSSGVDGNRRRRRQRVDRVVSVRRRRGRTTTRATRVTTGPAYAPATARALQSESAVANRSRAVPNSDRRHRRDKTVVASDDT